MAFFGSSNAKKQIEEGGKIPMGCNICTFTDFCVSGASLSVMSTFPDIEENVIKKVNHIFYEEIVPIVIPLISANEGNLGSLCYPYGPAIRLWQISEGNGACFELNHQIFAILWSIEKYQNKASF